MCGAETERHHRYTQLRVSVAHGNRQSALFPFAKREGEKMDTRDGVRRGKVEREGGGGTAGGVSSAGGSTWRVRVRDGRPLLTLSLSGGLVPSSR